MHPSENRYKWFNLHEPLADKARVIRQCGEKYFTPDVLKKMDETCHDIFDRPKEPERGLEVPAVSF